MPKVFCYCKTSNLEDEFASSTEIGEYTWTVTHQKLCFIGAFWDEKGWAEDTSGPDSPYETGLLFGRGGLYIHTVAVGV